MKLFASSTLMWGQTIDKMTEVASRSHLQGIELWAEQVRFSKMRVHEIRQAIRQKNLEITFHAASWDLNICSLNEGIRNQSLEEIIHSFALAASIDAPNVTVHPGRRTLTSEWTPWHEEVLQESLDKLEEAASAYGVVMSLEVMEEVKKEFVTGSNEMNRLVGNRSNSVQTTFDAAHVSQNKDILETFLRMNRVNKIHLSDSTAHQYHVALGEGELDLKPFIDYIREEPYAVVLEGYDTSENACLLRKHLDYLQTCFQQKKEELKR